MELPLRVVPQKSSRREQSTSLSVKVVNPSKELRVWFILLWTYPMRHKTIGHLVVCEIATGTRRPAQACREYQLADSLLEYEEAALWAAQPGACGCKKT
jgi:hypothetical protein